MSYTNIKTKSWFCDRQNSTNVNMKNYIAKNTQVNVINIIDNNNYNISTITYLQ